jgi:outer membrane protein OmpA-like peptidoglycan-associated protein
MVLYRLGTPPSILSCAFHRARTTLMTALLLSTTTFLASSVSSQAAAEEPPNPLADPETPLPPNAVNSVTDWQGNSITWHNEVTPLAGAVVSFRDALADLIASLKGWELIDEDMCYLIRMDSDLLFDFDSAALRAEAESALVRFAEVIAPYEKKELSITGHTDSRGSDSYNDKLSLRRAVSVKGFLESTNKLGGWSLTTKGRGERDPIASNETPDGKDDPVGRQKNRRVELRIKKLQ